MVWCIKTGHQSKRKWWFNSLVYIFSLFVRFYLIRVLNYLVFMTFIHRWLWAIQYPPPMCQSAGWNETMNVTWNLMLHNHLVCVCVCVCVYQQVMPDPYVLQSMIHMQAVKEQVGVRHLAQGLSQLRPLTSGVKPSPYPVALTPFYDSVLQWVEWSVSMTTGSQSTPRLEEDCPKTH